ncbi:MAG: hypothetical protein HQ510_06145 [Candidatus Marinimicrobia bacterium]|nr:hypothetical protein [Candidatus Neomarinimicrobiota bacterium]
MLTTELIGAWFSVFLTLGIISYLYDDNPFYKAAEHIFVGVSAGYWVSLFFWTQVQPNLFGRLWPRLTEGTEYGFFHRLWYGIYNILGSINSGIFPENGIEGHPEIRMIYLIPLILGIFMLLRLVPKVGWLARWAIAYIVGMAAGLRFYGFLNSDVMEQIKSTTINFSGDWIVLINGIIMVVGTLTGLLYFFFSKEHTGVFGKLSKIGIYFLMISFGASFGFAVMGRISLLIGRFDDLIKYSGREYHNATFWLLALMILLLFVWAFTGKKEQDKATA